MKKVILIFSFLIIFCDNGFSQVSDEIKQELINLYTLYAQSRNVAERLQYIRSPESYREIFQSRYGDREISYTPIRFGRCLIPANSGNMEIYALEEYVAANQGGRSVEVIQMRYFVKIGSSFKIDWEASVSYNPITLARFRALQDNQVATMRCYANLSTSSYEEYFAIGIRDEAINYQFTAYIRKNSEDGLLLMELLENGDARPVILEMQYSKEVIITKFIQRGWVR